MPKVYNKLCALIKLQKVLTGKNAKIVANSVIEGKFTKFKFIWMFFSKNRYAKCSKSTI